jgi:hypothetical protein
MEKVVYDLAPIIANSGLAEAKLNRIVAEFNLEKYQKVVSDWTEKANAIVITDASQITEMKMAGEGRKFLKKVRSEIENKRKELKEDSLREGQTIQLIANTLKGLIEPIEQDLEQKEKFAEIQESLRQEKLHSERVELLSEFMDVISIGINYGVIDDEAWGHIYRGAKADYENRIAEQKRFDQELQEAQKKRELHHKRQIKLAKYQEYGFYDLSIDTTAEEFDELMKEAILDKDAADEKNKIAQVNAEKEIAKLKEQADRDREIIQHEREISEAKEKEFAKQRREAEEKYLANQEELLAQRKAREQADLLERQRAERLASAGDKELLQELVISLEKIEFPVIKGSANAGIIYQIECEVKEGIATIQDLIAKL